MKILLITATYPPSVNGVAVSVSSLFHELTKKGHEVYVLAPKNGRSEVGDSHIIRYPSAPNPLVKDYPIPLLPINRKVIELLTKTKFDIVHAHHPFYIALFADIVSSLNNIPFVFTYHTRYEEYIKSTLKFLPKVVVKRLSRYTPQRVYKNVDVVVVPTGAMKRILLKDNPHIRFEVVPTGLPNFKSVKFSKPTLRKMHNLTKDKKILLSISRLGEEKNIQLLLKTLELLPEDYFLVLVGSGPMKEKLKRIARQKKIQNRVKFVGKIAHADVPEYYKLADIFVFPSTTETQGLTLLEAAHFGLPVVAVDSEVNREWVVKGAGIISKNNPKSFKRSIFEVDKLDINKVEKHAKNFSKNYSSEKITRKMLTLYRDAIKRGKRKKAVGYKLKEKIKEIEEQWNKLLEEW